MRHEETSEWVLEGAYVNDPQFYAGDDLHGIPPGRSRCVWINLDLLYPRDPALPTTRAVSGVDMTGVVPGVLHDWVQSGTGTWYGMCQFKLRHLDGRRRLVELSDQLVPAHALRQRERSKIHDARP